MSIAQYIDHTLLKPTATIDDISKLCEEAIENNFFAVCINPSYVQFCKNKITNTNIKIATVVGFPLGAMHIKSKIYEAQQAISDGADEIDMVLHIGFLKNKMYKEVENEIAKIKENIGEHILKVIIETCYLSEAEKIQVTKIVMHTGADYIKTSTGFGTNGATMEDILLIKKIAENNLKIKASGGIKTMETALKFISAGVSRIGTSAGVEIISGTSSNVSY